MVDKSQWYSISELAAAQGLSRQTLILYDRKGVFKPAHVDPETGYRWYSPSQLDELDTVMMLKAVGLSLDEIAKEMEGWSSGTSLSFLEGQLERLDSKIASLKATRRKLELRLRDASEAKGMENGEVFLREEGPFHLFTHPVEAPYAFDDVSIATKRCSSEARRLGVETGWLAGAILPKGNLLSGHMLDTTEVFLPAMKAGKNTLELPRALALSVCHKGLWRDTPSAYAILLDECGKRGLEIVSDSYEFALSDYLTTHDEREYVTKLMVYVRGTSSQESGSAMAPSTEKVMS